MKVIDNRNAFFIVIMLFILLLSSMKVSSQSNTITITITFDQDNINSTKFLVSPADLNLTASIGSETTKLVNGKLEFSENVFNLDQTMQVEINGKNIKTWTIPSEEYIHIRHVFSRWTGGQPAPINNVGLGQGALLTFEKLMKFSSINSSDFGELVVNTLVGSSTDLNADGAIETPLDPFGLLNFIFGMRDHLKFASTTTDADSDFSQAVNEILPNFSLLMEKDTVADFLTVINQSGTFLGKIYQTAFSLATSEQTSENLTQHLDNSFLQIFEIFNSARNATFGGFFSFSKEDIPSSSSQSETETSALPIFMFVVTPILVRGKKSLNKFQVNSTKY